MSYHYQNLLSDANFPEEPDFLISNKADVNSRDAHGTTPLQDASEGGYRKLVDLLLSNKAEVNATSEFGTALYLAVRYGHAEVVKLLLERGADINATSGDGYTLLETAKGRRNEAELIKILVDNSAPQQSRDERILSEIKEEFARASLTVVAGFRTTGIIKNTDEITEPVSKEMFVKAYTLVADKMCRKYGLSPKQFGALFEKSGATE